MPVCQRVRVSVSVCLSVCVSKCLSVCQSIYMSKCLCQSIHVSKCPCAKVSVCQNVLCSPSIKWHKKPQNGGQIVYLKKSIYKLQRMPIMPNHKRTSQSYNKQRTWTDISLRCTNIYCIETHGGQLGKCKPKPCNSTLQPLKDSDQRKTVSVGGTVEKPEA